MENTPTQNIAQLAMATPSLSLLVEAVVFAGLAEALSNPEAQLTVFAPTNEAFVKLLEDAGISKEALFVDANKDTVKTVLQYHVLGSKVPAASVTAMTATPMAGGTFEVMVEGGKVMLKDALGRVANVTATDIMATNGVVHVIDTVILPVGLGNIA